MTTSGTVAGPRQRNTSESRGKRINLMEGMKHYRGASEMNEAEADVYAKGYTRTRVKIYSGNIAKTRPE